MKQSAGSETSTADSRTSPSSTTVSPSSIATRLGRPWTETSLAWGDTYWGMDERTGDGKNRLGRILMRVREEIVEEGVNLP